MPTSLPETAASDDASAVRYAFKASLIGAAHQFELTDDGIAWSIAGRSGLWRYSDISAIRLSYRPVSMQARRFRADLQHKTGGRIAILSTTWQTVALMAPAYAAAGMLVTLVGLAMAGLLVRSVATGQFAGALFVVGFAALFAWQVGGFVRRNRPMAYGFDHLPDALLP